MSTPTENSAEPSRKKLRRPDGMEVERYRNYEKWTYRKWAWAFLRRNPKFKAACVQADKGSEDERKHAAELFGLKRYKSYKEKYGKGKAAPKFSFGFIASWSKQENDSKRSKKILISGGQVLIRFDIASAVTNPRVLSKQITSAKELLFRRLSSYRKNMEVDNKNPSKDKAGKFKQFVQLLDLDAAGKSLDECAAVVFPNEWLSGKDNRKFNKVVKDKTRRLLARARLYSDELYRELATRPEVPKLKGSAQGT